MDIQIAFRRSGETVQDRDVYACVGLLRASKGAFDDERVAYFGIRRERSDIREISSTGMFSALDMSSTDRLSCDLGNLLTTRSWRLPVQGEGLSLFLRKSRVDAIEPECEVFAFSGMLLVEAGYSIDEDAIQAFEGNGHAFARPDMAHKPEGGLVAMTAGTGAGSILKLPLWGFGEERVGLPGTLNLRIADDLDLRRLIGVQVERSPDEEAAYQQAGAVLRPLGLLQNETDDTFMAVLRYFAENNPQMLATSSKPMTAEDMEMRNEAMAEALRSVMPSAYPAFR